MKKDSTVNTFQDGLIMDLNPILTPNTALTNCLNGTIVTFNGNENVLQNDMGNGRVETAYLPEGYVPVGTTELGGIIYIVSYNPLKDKCQIGCFPSPERNITSDEIKYITNNSVDTSKFKNNKNDKDEITTTEYKVELLPDDTKLNPGDQYSIYATNKGITKNFDCLSFIGNTNQNMNNDELQIYKNVEIHVISISDDGKITYLDDSVKWFENTFEVGTDKNKKLFPADYYIKEVEGDKNETINNDINTYRSLISTAYNTFNSKTSGKLALLFKLNVIDTFSATWNINDMTKTSNGTYKTSINFDLNYTSKHSTINLSKVDVDIKTEGNVIVGINKTNHGSESFAIDDIENRKNNGEDGPINKSSKFTVEFTQDKSDEIKNKVTYTLTPAMKFGKLSYLNKKFTINLNKINSGDINVTGWRYFSTSNDVTIDLGLETYPKKGDSVTGVELVFYDPSNTVKFDVEEKDAVQLLNELKTNEKYIKDIDNSIEIIDDKSGYSGNIQHKIYLNDDTYPRNCLFLVDILIVVKTKDGKVEYNHNPRFLYTCGIFNSKYYEVDDFDKLSIAEFISPEAIVTTKKNTLDNTKTEIPTEAEISSLCQTPFDENASDDKKEEYQYKTMSVQKTTIDGEIEYDSKIVDKNWSELFMYYYNDKQTKAEYSVDYKDADPKADTNADDYTECVNYIYSNELPSEFPDPLIIGSKDDNDQYKDYFYIYKKSSNTIKVYGVLYSRMNAKVEKKTVHSEKYLRPVLLDATDLELDKLNLRKYKKNGGIEKPEIGFKYKYGMYTGDYGGGDSFYLECYKWEKTGDDYWDKDHNWNTKEQYRSPDGDFSKDGSFTTTWKNIYTYRTVFNDWMENDNNLFTIWFFNYNDAKKNMQKWQDSRNIINSEGLNYAIMVKTDDIFIPITYFMKATGSGYAGIVACNNLVQIIISLFCHLYYLVNNSIDMIAPVVTNINYLKDYTVNLNINLIFNISGAEVFTKNGEYDLTKSSNKKYKNIYILKNEQDSDFPSPISKIKPHSFFIKNDELYTYYKSHQFDTTNCIVQTLTGPMILNQNVDSNTVYIDYSNKNNYSNSIFKKISDLDNIERVTISAINVNKDNKLQKTNLDYDIYSDFLKCLKVENGKLYAESYKIVTDTGIMKAAEPSRKGTHFNITFKGGSDKKIGKFTRV